MTHKFILNVYFILFLPFLVAHAGARTCCHALPRWALRRGYPHGPPAAKQINTLIMIM